MRLILEMDIDKALLSLSKRLIKELKDDKNVLWLVSGGSNISSAVKVMSSIPEALKIQLTIMPVDERYGEVGHSDSNYHQLFVSGFKPGDSIFLNVLEANLSIEATSDRYKAIAGQAFEEADIVIALLGVGTDGHIAGILPNSPASKEDRKYVIEYDSEGFKRLTLTFPALKRIDAAYVYVYGESKLLALTNLTSHQLPPEIQPAQILKALREAYVYNDQLDN